MAKRPARSPATKPGYRKGHSPGNKGKKLRPDTLTQGEFEMLLSSLSKISKSGKRNRAMLAVMYGAGLRISEVLAMEPRHYHRGAKNLTVPASIQRSERSVGVDTPTRTELDAWLDARREAELPRTVPLFCSLNGTRLYASYVQATIKRITKLNEIEKQINPSALRRSYLKRREAERPRLIESHAEGYIEGDLFRESYPAAYDAWREAFDDYMDDPVIHTTAIGHHCRDAILAFAEELADAHHIEIPESAQSLDRMSAVLTHFKKDVGKRTYALLDALFNYWRAVVRLANRQEHGGEKSAALTNDDARRVVFNTMLVMYEIDKTISAALSSPG